MSIPEKMLKAARHPDIAAKEAVLRAAKQALGKFPMGRLQLTCPHPLILEAPAKHSDYFCTMPRMRICVACGHEETSAYSTLWEGRLKQTDERIISEAPRATLYRYRIAQ